MISVIIFIIWSFVFIIPLYFSAEKDIHYPWLIWLGLLLLSIITVFTGVHVPNNEGQYKGYVTAVERNGAIFKGWNVYLKTDLESSNEDMACIDRENPELIERLKEVQENKENVTLEYEGVWQYAIGECPGSSWMVIGIKSEQL